jgi:hypothetical protein
MLSVSHWGLFECDSVASKETVYYPFFEDGEWWWETRLMTDKHQWKPTFPVAVQQIGLYQ